MKLELPLAVVLLAAGSLLWNARNSNSDLNQDSQQSEEQITSALAQSGSFYSSGQDGQIGSVLPLSLENDSTVEVRLDRNVVPATFASQQTSGDIQIEPVDPQNSAPGQTVNGDPVATKIMRQSAENLFNSVPIEAKANITINLFEQSLAATGRYFQQGEGSRRARLEFEIRSGDETVQVTQLCDGRFHHSMQTNGNQKRLESVDLEKVAQANNNANGFLRPFGGLLLSGSISSLMENLSNAFDFTAPVQTELGGISMVSIKGTWKPNVLKRLVSDLVDAKHLEPEINWSEIPPQIPHAVEVTLGNDQFLPLFPYKILFYQFDPASKEIDRKVLQLELYEVGKLSQIPEEIFNIDSANAELIDSTEKYVYRVQQYKAMEPKQQAQKSTDSTKR